MVTVLIAQPFSTTGPCPAMPPKQDEETDEAGVNPIYIYISQIAPYIYAYIILHIYIYDFCHLNIGINPNKDI